MTLDQFQMYSKAAMRIRNQETIRMIGGMRTAVGADEKQYTQIMRELES